MIPDLVEFRDFQLRIFAHPRVRELAVFLVQNRFVRAHDDRFQLDVETRIAVKSAGVSVVADQIVHVAEIRGSVRIGSVCAGILAELRTPVPEIRKIHQVFCREHREPVAEMDRDERGGGRPRFSFLDMQFVTHFNIKAFFIAQQTLLARKLLHFPVQCRRQHCVC